MSVRSDVKLCIGRPKSAISVKQCTCGASEIRITAFFAAKLGPVSISFKKLVT